MCSTAMDSMSLHIQRTILSPYTILTRLFQMHDQTQDLDLDLDLIYIKK